MDEGSKANGEGHELMEKDQRPQTSAAVPPRLTLKAVFAVRR